MAFAEYSVELSSKKDLPGGESFAKHLKRHFPQVTILDDFSDIGHVAFVVPETDEVLLIEEVSKQYTCTLIKTGKIYDSQDEVQKNVGKFERLRDSYRRGGGALHPDNFTSE